MTIQLDPNDSEVFRFFGCANPRGRSNSYNGFELTEADAAIAAEQLVGKPVLIEHEGEPVGEVEAAWIGKDGRLMVVGKTSNEGARAKYARNMVIDGSLGELSLGSTASIDTDTLDVTNKSMVELSLVENGLRDGTIIEDKTRTERPSYKDTLQVAIACSAGRGVTMSATESEAPPQPSTVAPESKEGAAKQETPADPPTQVPEAAQASSTESQPQQAAPQQQQQQPSNSFENMSSQELIAHVARLTKQNQWLQDKAKRSYSAAFDAAAEEFLRSLQVEDTSGRANLINSLKQMTRDPNFAGSEGNAVMEVVCAASKQTSELQQKVEAQMAKIKEFETNAKRVRVEPPSQPAQPAPPPPAPNNYNHQSNREIQAPPRIDKRAPVRQPQNVSRGMQSKSPSMFQWLSAGVTSSQGMEKMDYTSIKGRDFSLRAQTNSYNNIS